MGGELSKECQDRLVQRFDQSMQTNADGLSSEVDRLSAQVVELEKLTKKLLKIENVKGSNTIVIAVIPGQALKMAMTAAVIFGWMLYKEISLLDIANQARCKVASIADGTRCKVAGALSTITKCTREKSLAISEKFNQLTEQIEAYEKSIQQKQHGTSKSTDSQVISELSKQEYDKMYSSIILDLLMEVGENLDEEFLEKVFDQLNNDRAAARRFVFTHLDKRRSWLRDLAEKYAKQKYPKQNDFNNLI